MIQTYKKELLYIAIIFLFKIAIIFLLPLTGDEAYFIKWAKYPMAGYYDHPPMVGWVIYLLSFINDSHIFFRLFSVVTAFVTAYVIYKISMLYNIEKDKAFLVALIFLASGVDLLMSLMTNDIVLLFFGSLGTLFLLYALEKQQLKYAFLSGLFLAGAFLSKYFAIFLFVSLLIFVIFVYRKKSVKTIVVVSSIIALAIAQNLWFNYNNCWNNILFNFFSRTADSEYKLTTILVYFAFILYIVTPWGIYYLIKSRIESSILSKLILLVLGFIFIIFFMVSLKNYIGLHWFLLFTPFLFLVFVFLDKNMMQKMVKYNAIFTIFQAIVIFTILISPVSLFSDHRKYSEIVLYLYPNEVCKEINSHEPLFTFGYSQAALLSYSCKKDSFMIFNRSKYGRLDDKLFDLNAIAGKDIKIFSPFSSFNKAGMNEVCQSIDIESFSVKDANFYIATCTNFNYDAYKKIYLDYINEHYYNIPDWLPVGECYFQKAYYQ